MNRILLSVLSLAFAVPSLDAAEPTRIPKSIRDHMERMVGTWRFEGHEGQRKFSGVEQIRIAAGGTALVQEGYFDLGGGAKESYIILSGWDGAKQLVSVRGFTSDGITWKGTWSKLKDGKWMGTASGSTATFEVREHSMRYEDSENGTPWVSEFTRVRKKDDSKPKP